MAELLADDGEKIHYQSYGQGAPIVLLHGWTASHREWLPFVDALAARHRVIAWDARAHGNHALLSERNLNVGRMAADLENLLVHLGDADQTYAVVGHSMGALTLWQYIRDFGCQRLQRLCLIDQSPRLLTDADWPHGIYGDFDAQRAAAFVDALEADFSEAVLRLSALGLNPRAREKYLSHAAGWEKARSVLRSQNPGPLIEVWKSLTAADYRDVLAQIDIPTLLIYGEQSNFYHTDTARHVWQKIPGAQLNIYPGTDHSPHQWQRERFSRELLDFFA